MIISNKTYQGQLCTIGGDSGCMGLLVAEPILDFVEVVTVFVAEVVDQA